MRPRFKFTASEDQYLRENYKDKPTAALSQQLGRSYQSVWRRCKMLGITPIAGANNGRPKIWRGCNETCPDFCPYDECEKP